MMQMEQRESRQRYVGYRNLLQEKLSQLRLRPHYLSLPFPPSSNPSPDHMWCRPDSDFNPSPKMASRRGHLQNQQQGSNLTSEDRKELGELAHENISNVTKKAISRPPQDSSALPGVDETSQQCLTIPDTTLPKQGEEQESWVAQVYGGKKAVLPPINVEDRSNRPGDEESEEGAADEDTEDRPQAGEPADTEHVEKKALREGAFVELRTLRGRKTTRAGKMWSKPSPPVGPRQVVRGKSVVECPAQRLLSLPTLYYSPDSCRPQRDSCCQHLHVKGKSVHLEGSMVRGSCQALSQHTVVLPSVSDCKQSEVRRSLPNTQGLTKAILHAANRLMDKPVPVLEMYAAQRTPENNDPRTGQEGEQFAPDPGCMIPSELDDSATLLPTSEKKQDRELNRGRLKLPPLPVARLSESKLEGHRGLEPITHHVPRLRLDHGADSAGLMFVTTTGRSGVTGLTAASYMSLETLEWKGQYMASGNAIHKDRLLSDIVQLVHQRMRANEKDLKPSCHDLRPFHVDSEPDYDVRLRNDHAQNPRRRTARGRSNEERQQPQKKHAHRRIKQPLTAALGAPQSFDTRLYLYLQNLSLRRKAMGQRTRRERVRFSLVNATIREITQSSMHTAAVCTSLPV